MFRRSIYSIFFVLTLGLLGSASAAVLYSDTFDRADGNTVGTNDNGLGGIISAPWIEVESTATNHGISASTLTMAGGNGNSYIDHKFTGDELLTSFTIEFDVAQNPHETADHWFALELAPAPESFTTGIDVNQNRVTFGFLMRPGTNFVVWDNGVNAGTNNRELIDNSAGPAPVKLQIDSPDGYNDGNTATIQLWINNVLVQNFGGGSAFDFTWQGHSDGLYISIENHLGTREGIDNLVISSPLSPTQAFDPSPAAEATDVPRDVVLNWMPGESADRHDVYFGASLDDVNDATTTADPAGVYVGRQSESTYAPGRLDLGQTYYWRIDEVNAAPDLTVFKGDVWQFTVEPIGYPIENITASASSMNRDDEGPENTINGSGLDNDDLHSSENTAMWLSNIIDPSTAWLQYEFDRTYKLHQMSVWNYNSSVEPVVGFGIKEATVEHSVDGADWSVLGTTHEFARGPGLDGYAPNTAVDLSGAAARYVRIAANSNWGGIVNQFGLSEVRFLYIPIWAREPSPVSGATDVSVDTTVSFRAGREAAKHDVYLSTNEQAVIDGTAPITTVTEPSYTSSLDLASTYYWRIDEVNDAETPTTWQGDIWSLSTQEYLVVEDFESYNDIEAGQEGSNLVYETWIDGFGVATNGSTIGYTEAFQPSMETSTVHDGGQSVPLFYDNTVAAYSEVTASLTDLQMQDWTRHGIKALTIRFFGDATNVVQQMYVKLNGAKVAYDGSAEDTRLKGWQMWYIDLASVGVSLSNVTELSIGFERIGALGGQGMVLFDAIRLYSYDRQLVTPIEPGTAGLQAHYEFEGTTNDSSGNARHGTAMGNPVFEAGKIGQAITFDGLNDYVNINGYKGITAVDEVQAAFSIACWVKTTSPEGEMVTWGSSDGAPLGGQYCTFRVNEATLRAEHGDGNIRGNTAINDGQWHHVALTAVEGANLRVPNTLLYVDGQPDSVFSGSDNAYNLTADADVNIGRRSSHEDRYLIGSIDDVRIYDRVLSPEEVAWLAGRIEPFDKPF
ncbi:MAG: LamG domain-containing protein [Phycisphaerales bacterium]|nr:MAG: LamG domain-containing protein [Phycisphaerales bacterium]